MAATYLPYCDAGLIDGELHGYLAENPFGGGADSPCKLFSEKNREEFFVYLKGLERDISPDRLSLLHDLYGDHLPISNL
jgi:hypothetical protein